MSLRRIAPVLGRLLVLALLVTVVPACKKKTDPSPHILDGLPLPNAIDVPHFPQMVLEWDKDLNPATFAGNVVIYPTDVNHNPIINTPWGGSYSFTYLPGSFQLVILNTTPFTDGTEYAVVIWNGLQSADGHAVNGGMALRFTVITSANETQPSFGAPAQAVGGNAGEIIWTWTQASEGGPVAATYDFYMSPAADGEDLLANPPFFTSNLNTGDTIPASKGLVTGTTYHFRVICRGTGGNITLTNDFTGLAR